MSSTVEGTITIHLVNENGEGNGANHNATKPKWVPGASSSGAGVATTPTARVLIGTRKKQSFRYDNRLCITDTEEWCVEFDDEAMIGQFQKVPNDPRGRSIVRLKPDHPLFETRSTNVNEFMTYGCFQRPTQNGGGVSTSGEVGDPTTRGSYC
jgi:hypothetical protein